MVRSGREGAWATAHAWRDPRGRHTWAPRTRMTMQRVTVSRAACNLPWSATHQCVQPPASGLHNAHQLHPGTHDSIIHQHLPQDNACSATAVMSILHCFDFLPCPVKHLPTVFEMTTPPGTEGAASGRNESRISHVLPHIALVVVGSQQPSMAFAM